MKELNTREMLSLRGGVSAATSGLNQANRAVTTVGNTATAFMTNLQTSVIHQIAASSASTQSAVLHSTTAMGNQITSIL
jgi:hypothetical protein